MHQSLLTMKEVSETLRVSLARAYELARTGLLPGVVRIGRQVRVDPARLESFIQNGGQTLQQSAKQTTFGGKL